MLKLYAGNLDSLAPGNQPLRRHLANLNQSVIFFRDNTCSIHFSECEVKLKFGIKNDCFWIHKRVPVVLQAVLAIYTHLNTQKNSNSKELRNESAVIKCA